MAPGHLPPTQVPHLFPLLLSINGSLERPNCLKWLEVRTLASCNITNRLKIDITKAFSNATSYAASCPPPSSHALTPSHRGMGEAPPHTSKLTSCQEVHQPTPLSPMQQRNEIIPQSKPGTKRFIRFRLDAIGLHQVRCTTHLEAVNLHRERERTTDLFMVF